MAGYPIQKDRFLLYWMFWGVAVWAAAVIAAVPGAVLLLMAMGFVVAGSTAGTVIMGLYLGGMVGLTLGFLQHRLMKQYFFVEDKSWWRRSAIAGIPAGLLVAIGNDSLMRTAQLWYCNGESYCYAMYGDRLFNTLSHLLPMTLFIGIVSLAQWSVLRRYVDDAWLWVLANISGGIIFGLLFQNRDAITGWLVATLAQGAATGAILLWLFLHRAQPLETPRSATGSVWDEAI